MEYSYQPYSDWTILHPGWKHLGMDLGKTTGMGKIVVNDNTVNYVAHAGQSTYNLKLTNNGTISTGVFEKFGTAKWDGLGLLVIVFIWIPQK